MYNKISISNKRLFVIDIFYVARNSITNANLNKTFIKISLPTIIALFLNSNLYAQSENELQALLTETTELATKTKLNIDYVPGTVSVISGSEMKALGITNLAEPNAFDMIVGMDTQSTSSRGSGADYGAFGSNVQWMINGKEFSNQIQSGNNWGVPRIAFPIPIDMVDRVEVIRGPGSSIYGGNAVFGIVNIITKKDYNGVFGGLSAMGGGKFGQNGGGSLSFKGENYKIDANLAGYKTDGYNLNTSSDGRFYSWVWNGAQYSGYGPGQLPNGNSGISAMVDIETYGYKTWLYCYQINSAQGGFNLTMPNFPLAKNGNNYTVQNSKTNIGIEKTLTLIDNIKITPKLYYTQTNAVANNFYYLASNETTTGENGTFSYNYIEAQKAAQLDAEYRITNSHLLNAGLFYKYTTNIQDNSISNIDSSNVINVNGTYLAAPVNPTDKAIPFWLKSKLELINRAAYIQDQWQVFDNTMLVYGLRYDSYAPKDANKFQAVSPRVAGVLSIDNENIIKAQYSRAFRPPNMYELSYTQTLKPMTVDTFELGYIHKDKVLGNIKATVFESRIYNIIATNGLSGNIYNATDTSKIDGAELEYKLAHELYTINANISTYKTNTAPRPLSDGSGTTYNYPSQQFDLAPNILGNIWVTLLPSSDYPTTIWVHYIGEQLKTNYSISTTSSSGITTPQNLSNGNLSAQNYVNITQQIKGILKGVDLTCGINDVFNTTIQSLRMPLAYYNPNNAHNTQAMPYMGRSFFASLAYKF